MRYRKFKWVFIFFSFFLFFGGCESPMKDVPLSDEAYVDLRNGFRINYPNTWIVEKKDDGVLFNCPDNECYHGNIHVTVKRSEFDNIDDLLLFIEKKYKNYLLMSGWDRRLSSFKSYDAIRSHNRMKGKEAYWEFEVIDFLSGKRWYTITVNYDGTLGDIFLSIITPPPSVLKKSLETFEVIVSENIEKEQ